MEREERRAIVRAGRRLEEVYVARQREMLARRLSPIGPLLEYSLSEVVHAEKCRLHAGGYGWRVAAEHAEARLIRALDHLARQADGIASQQRRFWPETPSLRELYEELLAARDEFGGIEVESSDEIAVTTEPIWLRGIHFGPFRIVLSLAEIVHSDPEYWYSLDAIDPNVAAADSSVTHPHVSKGVLCAGEATLSIRKALAAGRLSEFFVLVRSVLRTYNPGSPYVRLQEWEGVSCSDCGYTTSEESGLCCPGCEEFVCDDCLRSCSACGEARCRSCLTLSDLSDDWACPDCEAECDGCGRHCVKTELDEGLCPECQKENNDEESAEDDEANDDQGLEQAAAGAERAEVLAAGVAEAAVPLPPG